MHQRRVQVLQSHYETVTAMLQADSIRNDLEAKAFFWDTGMDRGYRSLRLLILLA
jgi:hypothetical protein